MSQPLSSSVYCAKCHQPLQTEAFNTGEWTECASCKSSLYAIAFPSLIRPVPQGETGDLLLDSTEASCYYHLEKKAATTCEYCGRFLCALCDIDWNGTHLCARCIETGKVKGRIQGLQNRRVLYDNIALGLAVVPLLLLFTIYFTFITAPIALYISIRHWNSPRSILPRTRIRFVIAIVLSILQIGGWFVLLFFLFRSWIS
jgi:hypothetical protein